jgi:hypothetical protein
MYEWVLALLTVLGHALLAFPVGIIICVLSAVLVIEPVFGLIALLLGIIYLC